MAEITPQEWERLPPRARLLINAGFVDTEELMVDWRKKWADEEMEAE